MGGRTGRGAVGDANIKEIVLYEGQQTPHPQGSPVCRVPNSHNLYKSQPDCALLFSPRVESGLWTVTPQLFFVAVFQSSLLKCKWAGILVFLQ